MKIVITGGAGFLGLHLAKYLAKKKNEVTLIDISNFNSQEYPETVKFIRADIRNISAMKKLTKSTDVIIHAAAALPLWRKKNIFDININGTENILQAAMENKVKHVLYISSTAVYGVPKKHPVYENDSLIGVGPYGESKIQAENLCKKYRQKVLIVTILRPKTFLGSHRLGVFEILFDWVKDGKGIPVIGSGDNHYQLLDVDDLVEAINRIIIFKDKKKLNTEFNIGAEKFKTVKEDLQSLFDYAKSGSKVIATPAFLIKRALWLLEKLKLSPLYQWVYDTADRDSYVSINRLVKTLHWHPKYSNSQALIKAYQWYLNNYDEIKSRPVGVTHMVGWKQGILGWIKKLL